MLKVLQRRKRLRAAYRATFHGSGDDPHPMAQEVLADLRRFCGISRGGIVVSPVSRSVDPYATTYRAGMRDVYLRIAAMLELREETNVETNDGGSE